MFCKYCGAKIEDNSVFCCECGKRLVQEEQPATVAESEPVAAPEIELMEEGFFFRGVKWYNKVGIALVGLFVLLWVAAITFYITNPDVVKGMFMG